LRWATRSTSDFLVVGTGLDVRFDLIPGLEAGLKHPSVSSIYDFNLAEKTSYQLHSFKRGARDFYDATRAD
jgi:hypothetical protein